MLVLTCTNTVVSLFRKQIPHEIRIPIYVMIIATTVTVVQLLEGRTKTTDDQTESSHWYGLLNTQI